MTGRLGRRFARRIAAASILAGAIIVGGLGPVIVAGDASWILARAPGTVARDVLTPIAVVVKNSAGGGVGHEIGCLVLAVPSEFSVGSVTIVSIPIGKSWSSASGPGTAGSTEVRLWADSDDSRLLGIAADQLTFTVGVVGATPGPTTWIADVYQKTDCILGRDVTRTFAVTIIGFAPTPSPSPTPTATPSPTATPTPALTPSPSPSPTPTPTPKPTPTPTLIPRATPTPRATPGSRSSPSPTPVAMQLPAASPVPSPASPGEVPASRSPAPSALPSDVPSATPRASGTPVPAEVTEEPPPGAAIEIGGPGSGRGASGEAAFGQTLSQVAMLFGRSYDWAVPGLLLSVPGMILVLAIAAQTAGALAWLPIVRRRIGGFGLQLGRWGRRRS